MAEEDKLTYTSSFPSTWASSVSLASTTEAGSGVQLPSRPKLHFTPSKIEECTIHAAILEDSAVNAYDFAYLPDGSFRERDLPNKTPSLRPHVSLKPSTHEPTVARREPFRIHADTSTGELQNEQHAHALVFDCDTNCVHISRSTRGDAPARLRGHPRTNSVYVPQREKMHDMRLVVTESGPEWRIRMGLESPLNTYESRSFDMGPRQGTGLDKEDLDIAKIAAENLKYYARQKSSTSTISTLSRSQLRPSQMDKPAKTRRASSTYSSFGRND
ncbi:hypothetical protein EPUS_00937 [Endocarpon pusillum Z07020]|uniref:Uncharacterized protein n=1 Tax=Endocarpon pusillum (strain Z07020 / HMAS-L-300199) TaxID=1263415 RepID=U1HWC8_ENDPU|nr:uncharacterized protein EPUS_00937 [Endocarpon pusillum Z07020]ERF73684.1 hypothetical protein EPUS_00937 [Endocarpon pusillum Z07020]